MTGHDCLRWAGWQGEGDHQRLVCTFCGRDLTEAFERLMEQRGDTRG